MKFVGVSDFSWGVGMDMFSHLYCWCDPGDWPRYLGREPTSEIPELLSDKRVPIDLVSGKNTDFALLHKQVCKGAKHLTNIDGNILKTGKLPQAYYMIGYLAHWSANKMAKLCRWHIQMQFP